MLVHLRWPCFALIPLTPSLFLGLRHHPANLAMTIARAASFHIMGRPPCNNIRVDAIICFIWHHSNSESLKKSPSPTTKRGGRLLAIYEGYGCMILLPQRNNNHHLTHGQCHTTRHGTFKRDWWIINWHGLENDQKILLYIVSLYPTAMIWTAMRLHHTY